MMLPRRFSNSETGRKLRELARRASTATSRHASATAALPVETKIVEYQGGKSSAASTEARLGLRDEAEANGLGTASQPRV
jgi:hypothetical protein